MKDYIVYVYIIKAGCFIDLTLPEMHEVSGKSVVFEELSVQELRRMFSTSALMNIVIRKMGDFLPIWKSPCQTLHL